ncbi:MAG: hypothetical protein GEU74_06590 [Nitriliruptorales bacterium]|nr:hypothetical protein [Nitriliruptorales bacterium]
MDTVGEEVEQDRVLAEIAIEPVGEGGNHGSLISEAVAALRDPALRVHVGPLATIVEGSFADVIHAVQRAHQTAASKSERVVTNVRIESKRGGLSLEERGATAEALEADSLYPEATETT